MRWQMMRRWQKIIGIFVLAIVGWGLLVYAMDWPISDQVTYGCPICRTDKTIISYFIIPVSIKVEDSEFSRYYKRYSDPEHRHVWRFCGVMRTTRTGGYSAHNTARSIPYEMAWAILTSLPKGQAQKVFFEKLPLAEQRSPEGIQVCKAVWTLKQAYFEDEHRRDWPQQLRKVGLYPRTDQKK